MEAIKHLIMPQQGKRKIKSCWKSILRKIKRLLEIDTELSGDEDIH